MFPCNKCSQRPHKIDAAPEMGTALLFLFDLILLNSERPKLYAILAFLGAMGLSCLSNFQITKIPFHNLSVLKSFTDLKTHIFIILTDTYRSSSGKRLHSSACNTSSKSSSQVIS